MLIYSFILIPFHKALQVLPAYLDALVQIYQTIAVEVS